jgi:hypothetical protein
LMAVILGVAAALSASLRFLFKDGA